MKLEHLLQKKHAENIWAHGPVSHVRTSIYVKLIHYPLPIIHLPIQSLLHPTRVTDSADSRASDFSCTQRFPMGMELFLVCKDLVHVSKQEWLR